MASTNEIISAINISSPWRGQNVFPDGTRGELAAIMYLWGPGDTPPPPAGGDSDGRLTVGVIDSPSVGYTHANVGMGIGVR